MKNIVDLTRDELAPDRLADVINGGHYKDVLYYEFHHALDNEKPIYNSDKLSSFYEQSKNYYKNIIGDADQFEAEIDIAIKLGDQWFIMKHCGANYYLGFGPQGILSLRKACTKKNIPIFVFEDRIDNWLDSESPSDAVIEKNEFGRSVNIIRNMTAQFERTPQEYQAINEESVRDRLLAPINGAFEGRAHAEAKSRAGKTDILIRTVNGNNEFIFELKVWKGISSFVGAVTQLSSYLAPNNNFCGVLMLCYNKSFGKILKDTEKYIEENFTSISHREENRKEFKFRMQDKTDSFKKITVTLMFVNLYSSK